MVRDLAAAVLAWVEHDVPDPPALCIVCRLDLAEIDATLCTARSGIISVIDTEAARPPASVDTRLVNPAAHRPRILRTAMRSARFREANVYEDAGSCVRAGELIDAFAPVGALAAATVRQLLGRHSNLDPSDIGFVLVGELAPFPLAADVAAASLPADSRLLTGGTPEADVLARGTELIASGDCQFPDAYPHALAVRTWEIREGRPVNTRLVIAPADSLDASGDVVFGASLSLTFVAIDPRAGGTLELDLLGGPDGVRPLGGYPIDWLQPGRHVIGVRLVDGCAELVARPECGGPDATRAIGPLPVTWVSRATRARNHVDARAARSSVPGPGTGHRVAQHRAESRVEP